MSALTIKPEAKSPVPPGRMHDAVRRKRAERVRAARFQRCEGRRKCVVIVHLRSQGCGHIRKPILSVVEHSLLVMIVIIPLWPPSEIVLWKAMEPETPPSPTLTCPVLFTDKYFPLLPLNPFSVTAKI